MPLSTTAKGDSFRDLVSAMLAAAGFRTQTEVRKKFKKIDVYAVWLRDQIDGVQEYIVETKDYIGTLPLSECSEFRHEYGALVTGGEADRAWLISRGPISPDGRLAIEAARNLRCFTFEEFQRTLIGIDSYLRELVNTFEIDQISAYYIHPHTQDNKSLEAIVATWLDKDRPPPLAIIGAYGRGKSTFARYLAAEMAKAALGDPTKRAPILVPLGEMVDENALEGLIGKLFTSRYLVRDYNFDIFMKLNEAGRFLVIFDGFDEMKHGMTLEIFERNIMQLMRLDQGNARILILGRDTAFSSDIEFKAIIGGRKTTPGGQEILIPGRRACEYVTLRDFTLPEAQEYVTRYFPFRMNQGLRLNLDIGTDVNEWITMRINELLVGSLDELLMRPVHAQMLCEIATDPTIELRKLSKFALYDRFLYLLADREVKKKGRHERFSAEIRRKFNANLAWWLWEQGSVSTVSLSAVPTDICYDATKDIQHDFDDMGLRRELVAGCLVEKGGGTVYFSHRSMQEFLVAEKLAETDLLLKPHAGRGDLDRVLKLINAEIIDFLLGRLVTTPDGRKTAAKWLKYLDGWYRTSVPLAAFDLFVQIGRIVGVQQSDIRRIPWYFWLSYFIENGGARFRIQNDKVASRLCNMMRRAMTAPREMQAAALLMCARAFGRTPEVRAKFAPYVAAAWLPRDHLISAIQSVSDGARRIHYVRPTESLPLWAFLTCSKIGLDDRERHISVNLSMLEERTSSESSMGFEPDLLADADDEPAIISCSVQSYYRALVQFEPKMSKRDLETIRQFFGNDTLRSRIRPLEVVTKRRIGVATPSPVDNRENQSTTV